MPQSRRHSWLEIICSTAFGFLVTYVAQFLIYPLMGVETSASTNLGLAALFTVLSILRGYVFRRLFNHWTS